MPRPEHRRGHPPLQAPAFVLGRQHAVAQRRFQRPAHWLGFVQPVGVIHQRVLDQRRVGHEIARAAQHIHAHHGQQVDFARPEIHRVAHRPPQQTQRLQPRRCLREDGGVAHANRSLSASWRVNGGYGQLPPATSKINDVNLAALTAAPWVPGCPASPSPATPPNPAPLRWRAARRHARAACDAATPAPAAPLPGPAARR